MARALAVPLMIQTTAPTSLQPFDMSLDTIDRLILAAEQGDVNNVVHLLDGGVSVDAADPEGHTALMAASRQDRAVTIEKLISRGASIDLSETHNRTALMFASANGSIAALKILLRAGAEVNRQVFSQVESFRGWTALITGFISPASTLRIPWMCKV
ncbi:MAG TPA: ankyrin repeat domain-containing protein [Bryobacteraceae bacterium]|nr:ankyrin repeat domain-containing protein [Bryobacteraceae bacterium]